MAKNTKSPKPEEPVVAQRDTSASDAKTGSAGGMTNPEPIRVEEVRPLSDFSVAPVAPDVGISATADSCDPHTGSSAWAMDRFSAGYAVRRATWMGAKTLDPSHPEGRIILHRDDLLARDWVFA